MKCAFFSKEKKWDEILDMHVLEPSKRKKTCYNQVTFCLVKIDKLKDSLQQPEFVKEIDWIDRYFPINKRNDRHDSFEYPRTQKVMLTSTRHAWIDIHIDYGGAAVWYRVFKGQKEFLLIKPTNDIMELYIKHITKKKRRGRKPKSKKVGEDIEGKDSAMDKLN